MEFLRKVALPLVLCLLFLLLACDRRLIIRKYQLESGEIQVPLRIVFVSDLHNSRYGKDQRQLLQAIAKAKPDLLLLGGDIFSDDEDDTNTEAFLQGISGKYICYFVTGNHEHWFGQEQFLDKMALLEKYGIPRLSGEWAEVAVKGQQIRIYGVDDPTSHMSAGAEAVIPFETQLEHGQADAAEGYTVLLSHKPDYFESYCQTDFDLVLCGHAHGGQWRIPGLINGLYAPGQGLFPKWAGGLYQENGTTMIVSRGLCRGNKPIPRIFNRPELVIIDLVP